MFDIEPHEQRYTSEWKHYLPLQLRNAAKQRGTGWKVRVINGGATSGAITSGAFMDFAETNIYKSRQVAKFAKAVRAEQVKAGDRVLFADAWHPGVMSVRYMADLLKLGIGIHVMWHAGSYDPADQLGQKIKHKAWSFAFEQAVYHAASISYFATKFHRDLFVKKLQVSGTKTKIVGWPMEYLKTVFAPYAGRKKEKIILFPHRMAAEKQPNALRALERLLPGYDLVFAQEQNLTKDQYRDLVARSEAVFSASLQETLGIGVYEGLLCGAMPIVPKRLSYVEMYPGWCYDSSWTRSRRAVNQSKSVFAPYIRQLLRGRDPEKIDRLAQLVGGQYFSGDNLYGSLFR
ncbi:glycosyltransferase family 4 protein [Pelagibacterium luteolum]|uniref:glycosyltransferase family 4 protein n=1 Tax=Pelagibacterium luteolum TaxID=440168 RepID=UPI00115FFFDF|nr:glycosyltransferase family 4 protein [Pelagibacterium luteolum]